MDIKARSDLGADSAEENGKKFERVSLQKNLNKTKAVICTPGFIWGQQVDESYKRQATGEGPTFRERNRTRVSCK